MAGPGLDLIEQMKIMISTDKSNRPWRNAADAFHLVIPSLPGYGFSGKPNCAWMEPR